MPERIERLTEMQKLRVQEVAKDFASAMDMTYLDALNRIAQGLGVPPSMIDPEENSLSYSSSRVAEEMFCRKLGLPLTPDQHPWYPLGRVW